MAESVTPNPSAQRKKRYRRNAFIAVFGVALVVLAIAIVDAIIEIWPAVEEVAARGEAEASNTMRADIDEPLRNLDLFLLDTSLDVTPGQAYIILILVFGVAGAFIGAATSFSSYVGNEKFKFSWSWWYLLRPFIGAAVALVLVVAILGGLVTLSSSSSGINPESFNPYTIAALAGLAGWFSRDTADKLEEIFKTILSNAQDEARGDKLSDDVPDVTQVTAVTTDGGAELTVTGSNFSAESRVHIAGVEQTTTFVGPESLTVTLDAMPAEGAQITVVNPTSVSSDPLAFVAPSEAPLDESAPPPAITSIAPDQIPSQTHGIAVAITGTGFVDGAKVTVNDQTELTPTETPTGTAIKVSLPGPYAAPGPVNLIVKNPDGQESDPSELVVM